MATKKKVVKKVSKKIYTADDIQFAYITAPDLSKKDADDLLVGNTIEDKLDLIAHNQLVLCSYIADILNLLDKK